MKTYRCIGGVFVLKSFKRTPTSGPVYLCTSALLVNYFIYGNILIACAAVAMILVTEWIRGLQASPFLWAAVFLGTFFAYNFQRMIRIRLGRERSSKGDQWLVHHWRSWSLLNGMALGCAGLLFLFFLPWRDLYILVPAGLVIGGYALPFIPLEGGRGALRDLPYAKVFLIAGTWTLITVFLPEVHNGTAMGEGSWLMSTQRFLFIIAITIPFDIRDLAHDETKKRTFPQMMGIKGAKAMSLVFIGLFMLLTLVQLRRGMLSPPMFQALVSSGVVAGIFCSGASPGRRESYYAGWLDGTMILQALFIALWA